MKKAEAIRLLGGTNGSTAKAIGITPAAVSQWPDELPAAVADRVIAALARQRVAPEVLGLEPGGFSDTAAAAPQTAATADAAQEG